MNKNRGISIIGLLITLVIIGILVIVNWDSIHEITSKDNPKDQVEQKIEEFKKRVDDVENQINE